MFLFNRVADLETIRGDGVTNGYAAYNACCFVANPWAGGDKEAYEAWGDGYDIGVAQARLEEQLDRWGMTLPANDD